MIAHGLILCKFYINSRCERKYREPQAEREHILGAVSSFASRDVSAHPLQNRILSLHPFILPRHDAWQFPVAVVGRSAL